MAPNSLIELNRSLFHSHESKEQEDRTHNNNNSNQNTNESWLSCALASHGSNVKTSTSTSTSKAPHQDKGKKQTVASMAMEDARVTQQSHLLESMVSTLTTKLRTQDAELKQFPEKHDRYVELFLALETVKEQLECAVHENLQLKRRAKGLEAAVAVQDIELDDHSSRMWNVAATQATDNDSKTTKNNMNANANANAAADKNQDGNPKEHVDQLDKLERERDTAVKQATQLAIQLAESQAAVDDLRDKMIECKVVVEYFQQNNQNQNHNAHLKIADELPSPSNKKMSFFWPRGGAMFSGTSTPLTNHNVKGGAADYDEENDDTEILSVSSISQESIVRLQQVHLDQQQQQEPQPSQPSENGSALEGLDYASATEDHNYL